MIRAARALALLLAVAGCRSPSADWLIAEQASPDGRRIARLWCEGGCEVPGRVALTISSRLLRVRHLPSNVDGVAATGDVPESDRVMLLQAGTDAAVPRARLEWLDRRRLRVTAPCPVLVSGGTRARSVELVALPGTCPAAR